MAVLLSFWPLAEGEDPQFWPMFPRRFLAGFDAPASDGTARSAHAGVTGTAACDILAHGHRLVLSSLLGIGSARRHLELARHRGLPRRCVGTRRGPCLLEVVVISPVTHDERRDQSRRADQKETECRHLPCVPDCFRHRSLL